MNPIELHEEFKGYHFAGNAAKAITRARGKGIISGIKKENPSPYLGEVARFIMLAYYKLAHGSKSKVDEEKYYKEGDQWWGIALQHHKGSGDLGGLAMLLIPPAFKSLATNKGASDIPTMLMDIFGALVEQSRKSASGSILNHNDLKRLQYEKMAYIAFRSNNYGAARKHYTKAIEAIDSVMKDLEDMRRSLLKVRGGHILATFGAAGRSNEAIERLNKLINDCGTGQSVKELKNIAEENVRKLKRKGSITADQLKPFEI
jgi:hypothetical protein